MSATLTSRVTADLLSRAKTVPREALNSLDREVSAVSFAASLLIAENEHTHGRPAADQQGRDVDTNDTRAFAWSIMGAVDRITSNVEVRRAFIFAADHLAGQHIHAWERDKSKAEVGEFLRRIADGERGGWRA